MSKEALKKLVFTFHKRNKQLLEELEKLEQYEEFLEKDRDSLLLKCEELETVLESHGIFKCELCFKWGYPVNRFRDCKTCSDAQYGD